MLRFLLFFSVIIAVVMTGCYEYTVPPVAVSGSVFTKREKDNADELLSGISVLSLDDAKRIALHNNPDYISAYHAVSAAKMAMYSAYGKYSPKFAMSFGLSNRHSWVGYNNRSDERSNAHTDTLKPEMKFKATWLLFDGLVRLNSVLSARHNLARQQFLYEDEKRSLLELVAYAYNGVLLADEKRRIAIEDRKFQQILLQDAKYKFEAGSVPKSNVLNFAILSNNASVSLVTAEYNYQVATYYLALLMGYPDGSLPSHIKFPKMTKSVNANLFSIEVYLDTALANRPDLKAERESVKISNYNVGKAYGAYYPTVDLYWQTNFDWSQKHDVNYYNDGPFKSMETITMAYGFNANWTIFNGLVRYNAVREAKAKLAMTEYAMAAAWMRTVAEVRIAYTNYIRSSQQAELYLRTRDLSAKQRDLVEDQFRSGQTEITRLNEAQRNLITAEANLVTSRVNVLNAIVQLENAIGVPPNQAKLSPKKVKRADKKDNVQNIKKIVK